MLVIVHRLIGKIRESIAYAKVPGEDVGDV